MWYRKVWSYSSFWLMTRMMSMTKLWDVTTLFGIIFETNNMNISWVPCAPFSPRQTLWYGKVIVGDKGCTFNFLQTDHWVWPFLCDHLTLWTLWHTWPWPFWALLIINRFWEIPFKNHFRKLFNMFWIHIYAILCHEEEIQGQQSIKSHVGIKAWPVARNRNMGDPHLLRKTYVSEGSF